MVKIEDNGIATYKFWFTLDVPIHDGMDEEIQALFEKVAAKIQEVCPFNDDDWNFSISDIREGDDEIHEVDENLIDELT